MFRCTLILNAGVMATPFGKTKDGFELQFGTNYLGHCLLANLLVPRLIEGAPSRVVSVSSAGHTMHGIRWDDYNFETGPYSPLTAYGQSKTANILFAVEFNRRYKDKSVTANSLHPGVIYSTELIRHINLAEMTPERIAAIPGREQMLKYSQDHKTIPQGAATIVYAALSSEAQGGKFYDNCTDVPAQPYACDPEDAKKLWGLGAKLVEL